MAFEVTKENDAWVSRVMKIPAEYADKLEVGDVLFGYIPTSELLTTRTGLHDILKREIEAGVEDFSFAVKRGTATWVVNFDYNPNNYAASN